MADIPGTTVFTGERSRQGYGLNRLAMSLTDPARREVFRAGEAGYMRAMGLSETDIGLVQRRDWAGMIHAGGSIYLIIKIAGTLGQNLLEVGAQMRGQTLDQLKAGLPGLRGH
jgi:protocatechuate 4,5-dioxygenase, alpha chain